MPTSFFQLPPPLLLLLRRPEWARDDPSPLPRERSRTRPSRSVLPSGGGLGGVGPLLLCRRNFIGNNDGLLLPLPQFEDFPAYAPSVTSETVSSTTDSSGTGTEGERVVLAEAEDEIEGSSSDVVVVVIVVVIVILFFF